MATNPYVAYAEQAAAFLFIDGGKDLQNALTFFQVLLGVSLVMTVVSIAIRVYQREKLWAFRISSGGFITPHYVFSTLLFSVFFIILELFCLQSMRKYGYMNNRDRRDALLWRSTRFLPLWLGGMMLLWATTLAPLLNPNRPQSSSRYDLARHPILVNALFLLIPTAFITLAFVLIGIADARWVEALVVYTELKRQLDLAVLNPASANILALSALESDLTKKIDFMLFWWTKANANLTSLVLFFAVAFGFASFLYLRDLQSTIASARFIQHPTRDSRKQLSSLKAIYGSLLVTTIAVEIVAINLFAVSLFVTCNLARIGQDPKLAFQVTIWTFFIYPVFGIFLNGGVLFRSLMLLRPVPKGTSTGAIDSKLSISPPPITASVELNKMLPSSPNEDSMKKIQAGRFSVDDEEAELHIRNESR